VTNAYERKKIIALSLPLLTISSVVVLIVNVSHRTVQSNTITTITSAAVTLLSLDPGHRHLRMHVAIFIKSRLTDFFRQIFGLTFFWRPRQPYSTADGYGKMLTCSACTAKKSPANQRHAIYWWLVVITTVLLTVCKIFSRIEDVEVENGH